MKKFVLMFILLTLIGIQLGSATIVNITPSEDTSVVQTTPDNTGYGDNTRIFVKNYGSVNNQGYLKFDLTGITNISSADLYLYLNISGGSVNTATFDSNDQDWSEHTATWNNPITTNSTGNIFNAASVGNWYSVNVTNLSKYYENMNFTIILKGATSTNIYKDFQSKEFSNGIRAPYISVNSWTTLKNYITSNVTYYDRDNISINMIFNVSYVSPGTQQWGFNYSGTDAGNTYNWTYQNNTVIQSLTATSLNETLEFMKSPALPTGIYYIQEIVGVTIITIPANSWGMFNNWTSTMTFAGIAANESNDICYTYYNVTSGLWESYYVGYSWNGDYQLSKDASVIGYFNAETDITSNIITPSSTELYTGWNMVALQGSSNQTISGIITDIGANCSDSWYFNSSTNSYSNTTTHSIQPNQGFLAYITQNMTWARSAM